MAARLGRKPSLSVREINLNANNSKPWWPPNIVPPKGAPNILLIMTDDQGYGISGTFGGVIPTPTMDRIAQMGLRYTMFHSTALCSGGPVSPGSSSRASRVHHACSRPHSGHFTRDRVRSGRVSQRICGCWLPYNPERAQRLLMSCSLTFRERHFLRVW